LPLATYSEVLMKNNDKLATFQAKQELIRKRAERAPKDNKLALIAAGAALLVAFAGQLVYFNFGPGYVQSVEEAINESDEQDEQNQDGSVPSIDLAQNRTWQGKLTLVDQPIEFELDGVNAPQAVANFVSLAKDGFFEGVSCHRLTTAGIFVLQCGDPQGDGTGGPGYNWGPIENAPEGDLYKEGYLAMARRGGDANSMGSQFFIVYQDSQIPSDAAGGYTVFGKLTSGIEVVKAIASAGTANGGTDGAPLQPVLLSGISVE
jgi:peptidyl-prolyl cis-trans isomerase B (cyclophilin B)